MAKRDYYETYSPPSNGPLEIDEEIKKNPTGGWRLNITRTKIPVTRQAEGKFKEETERSGYRSLE